MITSKKEYKTYIEHDRIALGISSRRSIKDILFPNYIFKFQKALRRYEYLSNCKKGKLHILSKVIAKKRLYQLGIKLGFSIPINVFGKGLAIVHYGTIIVSGHSKIGDNCRIHADTNIGASGGTIDAPYIGDNVYIGPGAKLYGKITIADNCAIPANSVVNKSFTKQSMMIAGVPAKEIKEIDIKKIIKHII